MKWLKTLFCLVVLMFPEFLLAGNTDLEWAAEYLLPPGQYDTKNLAEWTSYNGYIFGLNDAIVVRLRFDQEAINTFRFKTNDMYTGFGLEIDIVECSDSSQLKTSHITHTMPDSANAIQDTTLSDSFTNSEPCVTNGKKPHVIGTLLVKDPSSLEKDVDYFVVFRLEDSIPEEGANIHLTLQLTYDVKVVSLLGASHPLIGPLIALSGNIDELEALDYFVVESDSYNSFVVKPSGYGGVCWGSKTQSGECSVNYKGECSDYLKLDLFERKIYSLFDFFLPSVYAADNCSAEKFANPESIKIGNLIPSAGNGSGSGGNVGSGPDANVKKMQVSRAGKDKWDHSLTVEPGDHIDLEIEANNKGTAPVKNARIKYYRSEEGSKNFDRDSNHYLADDEDVDIGVGETITEHKRKIKTPGSPGVYYYYVHISYDPDVNKDNNTSSEEDTDEYVKVTVVSPSIKFSQASLSATEVFANEKLKLKTWSQNNGIDAKNDVHVGYYLSVGSVYNNPVFLGFDNIKPENFKAGDVKEEEFKFTVAEPGIYTVSAQLDCDNAIGDASTDDNWVHFTFVVKPSPLPPPPPPSIEITDPNAGEKWKTDRAHTINWKAHNFPDKGYVIIQVSTDDGVRWSTLDAHTANDGSKRWEMWKSPVKVKKDTKKARVKITSCEHPEVVAVSAQFKIDHVKGWP